MTGPHLVLLFIALTVVTAAPALGQHLQSPEVLQDSRVTFRFKSSAADEIHVEIQRIEDGVVKLRRDSDDTWIGTSRVLPAGIYEYALVVDGISQLDPRNRWIKKWYTSKSLFEVAGTPPLVTESQKVPHGILHHHTYWSDITDSQRKVIVYTPPGYQEAGEKRFPVLFLLHGFGDDQTAWTEVGRAHLIADNLIATGAAKEMIIVMPHGHPVPLPYGDRPSEYDSSNNAAMVKDIDQVLLPWVEQHYRVADTPSGRAITGLSMGGGHSIRTALATNAFAWAGAFSASAPDDDGLENLAMDLEQFRKQLQLFWIGCGIDDDLLERNKRFVTQLKDGDVPHTYVETHGAHNWDVWRNDYLPQFLPRLFTADQQ